MVDLIACPLCNVHVKAHERCCPHCGAAFPADRSLIGATATALLLGLSLSSCGSKTPEPADVYGAAPSDDFDDKKDNKRPAKQPDAKKPDVKQLPAKSESPPS